MYLLKVLVNKNKSNLMLWEQGVPGSNPGTPMI